MRLPVATAVAAVLCCLAHVNVGCETGVAHVKSVLSVTRSLLANADVALLKDYRADSVAKCMEECCTGTYGSCTIASFKINSTKNNCMHFNCRPLNKCKFLASNTTDTFSFSSQPPPPNHNHHQKTVPTSTKEDIATFQEEQSALKNDNTTVKPRKGVEEDIPLEDPHSSSSGVKPRKGVSTSDVPHAELLPGSVAKSNVKPRKGVPPDPTEVPDEQLRNNHSAVDINTTKDLMSELANVFADDVLSVTSVQPTSASSVWTSSVVSPTTSASAYTMDYSEPSGSHTKLLPSYTTDVIQIVPSSSAMSTVNHATMTRQYVSAAVEEIVVPFSSTKNSVLSTSTAAIQPTKTLTLDESSKLGQQSSMKGSLYSIAGQQSLSEKDIHPKLGQFSSIKQNSLLHDGSQQNIEPSDHQKLVSMVEDEEIESDRKYQSSIHVVLSLVFGLLVLFAVLGVVAKRIYDGWLRRDYYRMNYLIDGIYNGVE